MTRNATKFDLRRARRSLRAVLTAAAAAGALGGCSTIASVTDGWFGGGEANEDYATATIGAPSYAARTPIETGVAAWDGDISAPGMRAAHPTLLPGSWARVTNMATAQSVVVRVERQMPPTRGRDIELSRDAAAAVGALQQGVVNVLIEPIDPRQATPVERAPQPVERWTPQPVAAPVAAPVYAPQRTAGYEPRAVDGYDPNLATASIPRGPTQTGGVALGEPRSAGLGFDPHYLQIGSFRDRANAERLARELAAQGLANGAYGDAFVETAYIDGARFHRVRLGPLESGTLADRALRDAQALGHSSARVLKP